MIKLTTDTITHLKQRTQKMAENKMTIRIDRELYKKLQQIKLDTDSKSVSDVIEKLLKEAK